jgi:hypothetical protein
MRRPGRGDTLIKIASLGGGGVAVGGSLQKTASKARKNKEEIEKAKREEAEYRDRIKRMKMKQQGEKVHKGDLDKDGKISGYEKARSKAIEKAVAKKKMQKGKCPKCGGKGCSHCQGKGYHK